MELYPATNIKTKKGEAFRIPHDFRLKFVGRHSVSFKKNIAEIFARCFSEEIKPCLPAADQNEIADCVLICDRNTANDGLKRKKAAGSDRVKEAYTIALKKGLVEVSSGDENGIVQGIHTLLEIFRRNVTHESIAPGVIQGGPFVPIRAVHLFLPAREDIPFYKRFISRFLAPMHYNTVFLEVGGGMRFDRHPEINEGWSKFADWVFEHQNRPRGPNNRFQDSAHAEVAGGRFLEKDEVRELVAWTNSYGLEVIPEIQSLTHSYYLAAAHREIAELPEAIWPDAYCASNPRSYEILFDVMEEYIEVINPKTIHIGHDEWRAPALCPKCQGRAPELFAEDVRKIHDYLEKKNIKTAMWADGLLPAGDGKTTYTCIDAIPKDILLLHWYWSLDRRFLDRLAERGFKIILGNFGLSISQEEWRAIAKRTEVLGAEISSWVGMNQDRFAIGNITWNMLVGADLLWNGMRPGLDETYWLASEYIPQITSRLGKHPSVSCSRGVKSVPVDLTRHLNAPASLVSQSGKWNLTFLYPGRHTWRGMACEIANPWANDKKIGVAVGGFKTEVKEGSQGAEVGFEEARKDQRLLLFPTSVADIEIKEEIKGLVFYHFASTKGKTREYTTTDLKDHFLCTELLGYYQINYASGVNEMIALRYGLNIATMDRFAGCEAGPGGSNGPLLYASPAIKKDDIGLSSGTIWGFEWRNPRPSDRVVSVAIQSVPTDSGAFPVLIALNMLV